MDIAMTEALWRLGRLPVQAVEEMAVEALVQGFDGPALRELAWSHASWREVGDLFLQALREMGRPVIDKREAIARVIREDAAKLVRGEVDPFEGARHLFYNVWFEFDNWADYECVADLLRWANVCEGEPEQRDESKRRIIERARELLECDPITLSRAHRTIGKISHCHPPLIDKALCILLLSEVEPAFQRQWQAGVEQTRFPDETLEPPSLCLYLSEFARYTGDLAIKEGAGERLERILEQMERALQKGNEEVKNAVATCFLEALMHRPDLPDALYVGFLGPESIAYCKAWDEFTGSRTEGLWPPSEKEKAKRPWWKLW